MAALGVYSEVGKLRKVLVHRPDLSLKRLTPSNCEEQLPRPIVVTAYQSASGLLNLITPTSVIIMGALAVARTGYDRWFRFVWPLLLMVMVATMLLLSLCAFGLGAK